MAYAETTTVPVEKSRSEIERILERYGADAFMYGWNDKGAAIAVPRARQARQVRAAAPRQDRRSLPLLQARREPHVRTPEATLKEWEQACRQRWRALALVVKAKLEAVEAGITLFEAEFMAHIVLPSGETVGEWMGPQIEEAYASGLMPQEMQLALPPGRSPS